MASSSTASHSQTESENAFEQIAPFCASTSEGSWQIFINHRGPDVKKTLATKVHDTLCSMGFRSFLDVEIEPGDVIPAAIQAAMKSASLHIAIFSPKYAESAWCLAELAFMLKTGAKIIPIFYQVEPNDLRWVQKGKGKYAPAFSEYEQKGWYNEEKLNEWKNALCDISNRSGYKVNDSEDEARVLKEIENCALKVLEGARVWVGEHPLGLDELVQDFQSVASEDKVKITGIVGMGGSGKTTLAKELFNRNSFSFEKCSFVDDVRDAASRNALPDKQKKLLKDLHMDDKNLSFGSVDEGKAVLANRLRSLRALIVVDDADHIDQLDALLPNKDELGNQSMVIITSRDLGVLKSWGLSCIYKMPPLGRSHAEQLFCWHAFKKTSPPADFQTLVQDFLKACNGLPLSLKVLGAQLSGHESEAYWKSLLRKILRILPHEIEKRLQISYDALDKEGKEMFLDVACFLIGERKCTAIAVWDGMHWSGVQGLQTLVNKCLVELVPEEDWCEFPEDKIRMHDHLRDMGREIASGRSPYRLWRPEQIDNMRMHFKKRMPIRGILPPATFLAFKEYRNQLMGISKRQSKSFKFSNKLQILHVEGNEFSKEFASLSEDVVWLRWDSFPLKVLPPWLTLRHLSVLELCDADELEELWKNKDPPPQLKELTIRGGHRLEKLPTSIGHLQYLEYLHLYCQQLRSLPAGFGNLINLKRINLLQCKHLSTLPDSFKRLINLEILSIVGGLSSLPDDFGNLIRLKCLGLNWCSLSTLPDSFSQLISLEDLDLSFCQKLSSLPEGFGNLKRLKHIKLRWCRKLSILPNSFSQLKGLEDLNLTRCEMLSSLPGGFGNLTGLKHINLEGCTKLSTLPESFKHLVHLDHLNLTRCVKLKLKLDAFENMKKLKMLGLSGCKELEDLPNQIANQASLTELDLEGCIKLSGSPTNTSQLVNLQSLTIESVMLEGLQTSLVSFSSLKCIAIVGSQSKIKLDAEKPVFRLSISNDCCPNLESFVFSGKLPFNGDPLSHLVEIKTLPVSLKRIVIFCCEVLNISCLSDLVCLECLVLKDCRQLKELSSFSDLASLKVFSMLSCPKVEKIGGLQQCKRLERLTIAHCPRLRELPSFAASVSLEHFKTGFCPKVEKIEGLQHCDPLKYFEMSYSDEVQKI